MFLFLFSPPIRSSSFPFHGIQLTGVDYLILRNVSAGAVHILLSLQHAETSFLKLGLSRVRFSLLSTAISIYMRVLMADLHIVWTKSWDD